MAGIGIVSNPHSKLNRRNPKAAEILSYIVGQHGQMAVTHSLEELSLVAQKFQTAGIDILAINGGDGTISQTLRVFIETYGENPLPQIAILGGGTMNVLASNLGIRGLPPTTLGKLVELYSTNTSFASRTIQALRVEKNYGFLYADGTCYHTLKHFYQKKGGPLAAAYLVLRIGLSLLTKGELASRLVKADSLEVRSSNFPPNQIPSLGVLASTLEYMPYGLRFFKHVRQKVGLFQTLIVSCTPRSLPLKVPSFVFDQRQRRTPEKWLFVGKDLSLSLPDGKYPYSLDGELYESNEASIKIELGPKLNFVLPHKSLRLSPVIQ